MTRIRVCAGEVRGNGRLATPTLRIDDEDSNHEAVGGWTEVMRVMLVYQQILSTAFWGSTSRTTGLGALAKPSRRAIL